MLDAAGIEVDTVVTEEEISALYDERSEEFVVPEQRRARHILISAASDAAEDIDTARVKAEQVVQRLEQGGAFETVAGEVSDDAATASAGGDLGFFGRGIMVPEFEEAAFSMTTGERSQPVQSSFGFHIIELLEIQPEVATPLEEVRESLVESLQESDRNELFHEQSEMLSNLAFEQPDSLETPAEALGLEILESDWITRDGGSDIAANPGVVEAAFSDDVLLNGYNSSAVEIEEDRVVVVRLLEHQQAALQPLADIREVAEEAVRSEKLHAALQARGQQLLADLGAGTVDMTTLAERESLEMTTSDLVQRQSADPSRALVSKAFALPRPANDGKVFDGMHLPEGDYALLELKEVQDGEYDQLQEAGRKSLWRSLNEIQCTSEMHMVLNELKSQGDIQIPESGAE
jgi:peptidyl-prolyl cis-trans isomerase D